MWRMSSLGRKKAPTLEPRKKNLLLAPEHLQTHSLLKREQKQTPDIALSPLSRDILVSSRSNPT